MKQTFILAFSTLLFTQACKKGDHTPDPNTGCKIQTHLVRNESDPSQPPYVKPYQYTRTFGPDGKVNFAELYLESGAPFGLNVTGTVSHTGNRVFMINAGDTLLAADLNRHGQPTTLLLGDNIRFFPHTRATFRYDNRNRLVASRLAFLGSPTFKERKYQYDGSGNVTRITEGSNYTKFTYDYSRPIKGGDYNVGGMDENIPWEVVVMKLVGHLDVTSPHHLLKEMTSTYEEGGGTSTYSDQKVNEKGYLISYRTSFGYEGELIWNCDKNGVTKY